MKRNTMRSATLAVWAAVSVGAITSLSVTLAYRMGFADGQAQTVQHLTKGTLP